MNRREFNKQETIRHIKSNFVLCLDAYGIDKININELCVQCKVAKSTFYQYFDDKYSILEEIEQEVFDDLVRIVFDPTEAFNNADLIKGNPVPIASEVIHYLSLHKKVFKALLGPNGDQSFVKKWHKYIMRSFEEIFQRNDSSSGQDKLASSLFASSLLELYRFFLSETPKMTERECSIRAGNLLKCFLYDFGSFID
ncbi:MAG: TetR/AcrR family transcriptional regulator [Aeriscardovia sp.]|nr:TetR/AcrR family transcriptional regulator [Aeriscardovia sp.]